MTFKINQRRDKTLSEDDQLRDYTVSSPEMPTFLPYSGGRPDVLDIFLRHSTLSIKNIETLNEFNSGHNPVLVIIDLNQSAEIYRNVSKTATKWNIFLDYLKAVKLPSGICNSIADVNEAICSINESSRCRNRA